MISQDQIKNFKDNIADGVTYNLEISTKNKYKLIRYRCPEYYSKTEINNKKFTDILLLLDQYFHFWSPKCL